MATYTLESPSPVLTEAMVRLTTDQYHKIIEQGIIPEDASTELLDGVIVYKDRGGIGEDSMGHSPEHVLVVSLLSDLAASINGPGRHLKIQLPICIMPENEPEPDASIVRGTPRDYVGRLPAPADVFCVIEVAGSSLERDLQSKLQTYAKAGIPQYVVINLRDHRIEIYESPTREGTYRTRILGEKTQTVRLNLGNGESLDVVAATLLP